MCRGDNVKNLRRKLSRISTVPKGDPVGVQVSRVEKPGFLQNPASPASDLASGRRGREGVPDADKEGLQPARVNKGLSGPVMVRAGLP